MVKIKKQELINNLNEFLIELKYAEKSENTLKKYKTNLTNFFAYLSDDEELTKDITLGFKQHIIGTGYKTSTINSHIIAVNKYLKWNGINDLSVKTIKQQRKHSLEDVINNKDYKRLLRYSKKMYRMDIYYIMKILAMTGIRISELKYFTVENIKSNYIIINNKGKERTIVIRQDLIRELRKYCRDSRIKSGYIFYGEVKGKMIAESTIWRNMKKIAGKARVKKAKVHAHSFRHFFAKNFLGEYSGNITELADILGHEDLATTRIYTMSTDAEKREKMEKIKY